MFRKCHAYIRSYENENLEHTPKISKHVQEMIYFSVMNNHFCTKPNLRAVERVWHDLVMNFLGENIALDPVEVSCLCVLPKLKVVVLGADEMVF